MLQGFGFWVTRVVRGLPRRPAGAGAVTVPDVADRGSRSAVRCERGSLEEVCGSAASWAGGWVRVAQWFQRSAQAKSLTVRMKAMARASWASRWMWIMRRSVLRRSWP
jgi:hypothetical protein